MVHVSQSHSTCIQNRCAIKLAEYMDSHTKYTYPKFRKNLNTHTEPHTHTNMYVKSL